jgi:hypothetical protein
MTTKQGIETHRTVLALINAAKSGDDDACGQVLAMGWDLDFTEFVTALAGMVEFAFHCDPAQGWEVFTARYLAAIDAEEAKLQRKTDT